MENKNFQCLYNDDEDEGVQVSATSKVDLNASCHYVY